MTIRKDSAFLLIATVVLGMSGAGCEKSRMSSSLTRSRGGVVLVPGGGGGVTDPGTGGGGGGVTDPGTGGGGGGVTDPGTGGGGGGSCTGADLEPIHFDDVPRSCERSRRHSRRCGVRTEEWRERFSSASRGVRCNIRSGLHSEETQVLVRIFERHLEEERRGGRCDRDEEDSSSGIRRRHRLYAAGIAVLVDLFRDNPVMSDVQLCELRASIRALSSDLRGPRCGDREARAELLSLASIRLTNAVIRFKQSESASDFREIRISIELLEEAVRGGSGLEIEIRQLIKKFLRDQVGREIESSLR